MSTILNQVGLALNIFGSLLIAFSIGKPSGGTFEYHVVFGEGTPNEKIKKFNIAVVKHPCFFKIGITFLSIGFLLMFINTWVGCERG